MLQGIFISAINATQNATALKILPLAIGAGAVYLLARSFANTSQALQRLTYANPKIKVNNVGLLNTQLTIALDITNPASANINLDYFTGNIIYQGKTISSFTFNANGTQTTIKARSTSTIPFTVNIKNLQAIGVFIALAKDLASGQKIPTVISVNGSLYAAGFDVPVRFDYDVKNGVVVPSAANKIAGVEAKLQFSSVADMEKYFSIKRAGKKKLPVFSKN